MSGARRDTASARGTPIKGHPDEVSVTFRVTKAHHKIIKDSAIRNHRAISQECAWRVLASIEAEERKSPA